jgi:ribokinase
VNVSRVLIHPDETSGHAIIQVAASGENAIVLHPGTNHAFSASDLPALLASFSPGDWFLAQNETSCVPEALHAASAAGLRVVLNPAPMSPEVKSFPLDVVDLLVVNETEAAGLSGKATPHEAMDTLRRRLPRADIVLTLGARGAWFSGPSGEATASPPRVHATDTTAAGDTFIGYLLAGLMEGAAPAVALARACTAAAISTTRPGAASSIPSAAEVAAFVAAK